jgi:hypothetical protein
VDLQFEAFGLNKEIGMACFFAGSGRLRVLGFVVVVGFGVSAWAQESMGTVDGPLVQSAPIERKAPEEATQDVPQPVMPAMPVAPYDPGIFQKKTPVAELAFLGQFGGAYSNEVVREKDFHRILHEAVPTVMFHYGRDMSLSDAMNVVLEGSSIPVQIREGRYVTVAGNATLYPYLYGRGFVWIDMQEGIVIGGFYFHPTNGEPTPTVTIFSKQIKTDEIELSQLPPAFGEDLARWTQSAGLPMVTTRYFIGDANEKILLQHDEDYCSSLVGRPGDDCMQMMADAADADMVAASYLEQVNYATNATARMIANPDQIAWVQGRDRRGGGAVGCASRSPRERVHTIVRRPVRR